MTMTDRSKGGVPQDEDILAPWFEAARQSPPEPSADWLARMEEMALEMQPAGPAEHLPPAGARDGVFRRLLRALGGERAGQAAFSPRGWPAAAGLVAACAAGVWLGAAVPSELESLLGYDTSISLATIEPASSFDYAMLGL